MKKTSILIPAILVVCLIALALLVSRAISASEQSQTRIEDRDNFANPPSTADLDSTAIAYAQDAEREESGSQAQGFQDLVPATDRDSTVTASGDRGGNFLVIAGTFRQLINARTRVRDLKEAGFSQTSLENFDRGTYAVALVDQTDTYQEARQLAERVQAADFEVKVYRRR